MGRRFATKMSTSTGKNTRRRRESTELFVVGFWSEAA
jgi:hypothetical protein